MPIHKIIEGGGEYLPFALAQERKLRAIGVPYISKAYEIGDVSISVKLEGEHSHIRIKKEEQGGYVCLPHSDGHPNGVALSPTGQTIPATAVLTVKGDAALAAGVKVKEHKNVKTDLVAWQAKRSGKVVALTTEGRKFRGLGDYAPRSRPSGMKYYFEGKEYEIRTMVNGSPTTLEILGMAVEAEFGVFVAVCVDPYAYGDVMVLTRESGGIDWLIRKRNLRALLPDPTWTLSDRVEFAENGRQGVTLSRPEAIIGLNMRSQVVNIEVVPAPVPSGGGTRSVAVNVSFGQAFDVQKTIAPYVGGGFGTTRHVANLLTREADRDYIGQPAGYIGLTEINYVVESQAHSDVTASIKLGVSPGASLAAPKFVSLDIDATYYRKYGPAETPPKVGYSYTLHGSGPAEGADTYPAVQGGLSWDAYVAWILYNDTIVFEDYNKTETTYTWRSGAASFSCPDGKASDISFGVQSSTPQSSGRDILIAADPAHDYLLVGTVRAKGSVTSGSTAVTRLYAAKGSRVLHNESGSSSTMPSDPFNYFGSPGASQGPGVSAWLYVASGARTAPNSGTFARRLNSGFVFSADSKTYEDAFKALGFSDVIPTTYAWDMLKKARVVIAEAGAEANNKFALKSEPNFAINPITIF